MIDNTAIWAAVLTAGAGIIGKGIEYFLNWKNESKKIDTEATNEFKNEIEYIICDIIVGIHNGYSAVETILSQLMDAMQTEGTVSNKDEYSRQLYEEIARVNYATENIIKNERLLRLKVPIEMDGLFYDLKNQINETTNILQNHILELSDHFSTIDDNADKESDQYKEMGIFLQTHKELKKNQQEPINRILEEARKFLAEL